MSGLNKGTKSHCRGLKNCQHHSVVPYSEFCRTILDHRTTSNIPQHGIGNYFGLYRYTDIHICVSTYICTHIFGPLYLGAGSAQGKAKWAVPAEKERPEGHLQNAFQKDLTGSPLEAHRILGFQEGSHRPAGCGAACVLLNLPWPIQD